MVIVNELLGYFHLNRHKFAVDFRIKMATQSTKPRKVTSVKINIFLMSSNRLLFPSYIPADVYSQNFISITRLN